MFYGSVAIALIASYVASQLVPADSLFILHTGCEIVAVGATITLVTAQWSRLARLTRNFIILVAAIIVVTLVLHPTSAQTIWHAAVRGSGFAAFLATIGLIRIPLIASKHIRQVSSSLLASSGKPNSLKSSIVAQFVSLLFNVGAIRVIHDLSGGTPHRDDPQNAPKPDNPELTNTTLHAMRNAAIMTLWSPIGVGFVIVTSGLPHLNITQFFLLAMATGAALTVLSTRMGHITKGQSETADSAAPKRAVRPNLWASLTIVIGFLVMVAGCIGLAHLADIPMIAATTLVIALVAILWIALSNQRSGMRHASYFTIAGDAAKSVTNEGGLFMAATLLSSILVAMLTGTSMGIPTWLSDGLPLIPILAIAILIPALAGAYVPHPLLIISAVQVMAVTPVASNHPYSLALALVLAWAMSICTSPVSAMSMVTARLIGMTSSRVAHHANLKFELASLSVGTAFVCGAFALEMMAAR
ncbi:hypothetical protein LPB41_01390 [Thalassospira sp. MA62]|nr:hypothetical protein [Thalassospira sp. MA62]